MPSSLPNGSASVEPTPRWPVVGTLMGGRAHQRQPSFPTTHRAFPTTHNTQQHTTHKTQHTMHNIQPSLTLTHSHSLTHPLTHSHTHTLNHSLTPSLPPLPPSLTHSLTSTPLHFTSLHFTSFHFTHSLTYIIIIMCQRCLPATGHAERVHKMCGCARKSAEHYFGQRKYGEHTIVLIVCRKKTSEPGGTR